MGKVISFEKAKKKNKDFNSNKKKSKLVAEKTTTNCPAVQNPRKDGSSIDVDYTEMELEQQIDYWKNIEKEEEERFKDKYKDLLAAAPISASERMQYFSKAMLYLLSEIFHGSNWDIRFDAWLDFCEFYLSEFDPAYDDYIKANQEFEQSYQYKFQAMAEEELEKELVDCLGKIIELCPERKEEDNIAMMYQAARLFELEEILSDMFYKELLKE